MVYNCAMSEHLDYAVHDGVATITIDRPVRRNALTCAMYDGLDDLVARSAKVPGMRSIILIGVPGSPVPART